MPKTATLSATEFKAKCLDVLDRLAARKLERVVVTKRGRAVAVLTPPEDSAEAVRRIHGFMRGAAIIPEGFDLTAPILDERFTAEQGNLHE
jgi:prevent-host-death family protein